MTSSEELTYFGGNAKMTEFAAAMGLCNLRHIDKAIASRKQAAQLYREKLGDVKGLSLSAVHPGVKSNYAYFPVIVDPEVYGMTRDELADLLAQNNIGARKYFYPLTSTVAAFGGKPRGETPIAEKLSGRVLCLPLFEGLEKQQVERICSIIVKEGKRV